MINIHIRKHHFFYQGNFVSDAYRVFAEDENHRRSFDIVAVFFERFIIPKTMFCGKNSFVDVGREKSFAFKTRVGRYFDDFDVYIQSPSAEFSEKIECFNKSKKINEVLRRYDKPELLVPSFCMDNLLQECELVFVCELHRSEFGDNFIFFDSRKIKSVSYVIELISYAVVDVDFNIVIDDCRELFTSLSTFPNSSLL